MMVGESEVGELVCVCFGDIDLYSTRIYYGGQGSWIVFSILVTCKTFY